MSGITQEQIAEKLNISRTTVARALNNRGYVKHELKSRILALATEHGYKTNQLARSLVMQQEWNVLCFLVSYDEDFAFQMESGIQVAAKEFAEWGVKTRVFYHSPRKLRLQVDDFEKELQNGQVDAVLIGAMDPDGVMRVLKKHGKETLPLAALNLRMSPEQCLFYVGTNDVHAGEISADMIAKLIGARGDLLYINNFGAHAALDDRFTGFFQKIRAFPDIHITVENDWMEVEEDVEEDVFYRRTLDALQRYPKLRGICSNTSIKGVERALRDAGRQDVKLIGNDWSEKYREYFQDDAVNCIVCQRPTLQGYLGLKYLAKYLIGSELPENFYTCVGFDIVTAANMDTEDYFKLLN